MIYPMFAMVILTYAVFVTMAAVRFRAVLSGKMSLRYFVTYDKGAPTELVAKTQRHFVNLFEVPVLFYAGCLASIATGTDGATIRALAWAFVVSRVVHALIHIGPNRLYPRMFAFFAGAGLALAMWIAIVVQVAGRAASAN